MCSLVDAFHYVKRLEFTSVRVNMEDPSMNLLVALIWFCFWCEWTSFPAASARMVKFSLTK